MNNKLKGVIEAMLDGGLEVYALFPLFIEKDDIKEGLRRRLQFEELSRKRNGRQEIVFRLIHRQCTLKGESWVSYESISFYDIITDPAAIGALVGEGKVCHKCGGSIEASFGALCYCCYNSSGQIAYIYHMHQLAQICGENKDPSKRREKVVGYLRGLVKEKCV